VLINYTGARVLSLTEDMTKSVVFVASSKTLPLALAILSILPPGLGDKGLIALPCILGHFSQES
jgi:predicted Na+-dependent transporter